MRADAALPAAPLELRHAIVASLAELLADPTLGFRALTLTHALARVGALPANAQPTILPPMRRALAALPASRDVQRLCDALSLPCAGTASRAALHAAVLGMSEDDFVRLGDEPSAESEAEHELFWQAEHEDS